MLQMSALLARTWTNYAVDVLLLLVLFGFAFACAKKGFIECFFKFVSVTVAIVAAILLSKMFISLLDDWFGITTKFADFFENTFLKVKGFETVISNEGLQAQLTEKNIPKFLIDLIIENFGNSDLPKDATIASVMGESVSKLAVSAIAFVVLFLGGLLVMKLLKKFLKLLASKISILGTVDQLLGASVGLIEGFVLVSIVLSILSVLPIENIGGFINDCMITSWVYNNNILSIILGWIGF